MVTDEVAQLIDPICRAELSRMDSADEDWSLLLRHLSAAGPSTLDNLQAELSLKPKDLKAIRAPLERCGAVVSRSVVFAAGDRHVHSSELVRWDQVYSGADDVGVDLHHSFASLLVASVRAAVVAPEKELTRWFSWQRYWTDAMVHELVEDGRLRRVDGYVTVPT
jgi:hypothetical protein